jgi:hypothetical protein
MTYYPIMGARNITDYRSSSDINNAIMQQYNIKDNNEYRKFINSNGNAILQALREQKNDEDCMECPVCKAKV